MGGVANVISGCICLQCESLEKQSAIVYLLLLFAHCPISNLSLYLFGNLHIKKDTQLIWEDLGPKEKVTDSSMVFFSLAHWLPVWLKRSNVRAFGSGPISGTHDGCCTVVKRLDSGSNTAWLMSVTPVEAFNCHFCRIKIQSSSKAVAACLRRWERI